MNRVNNFLLYICNTRARESYIRTRFTLFTTVHCATGFTNLLPVSAFLSAILQTAFALVKQRSYSRKPLFIMLTWYSGSCKCMSK